MAHDISQLNGKDQFARIEDSAPAWHEKHGIVATIVPAGASADMLATAAGIDAEIKVEPLMTADGIPAAFATVRQADRRPLGVVGQRYTVVPASRLAAIVDGLASRGIVRPDTAMGLKNGSRMCINAEIIGGTMTVKPGDTVSMNLAIAQGFDGTMGCIGMVSGTRTVCANTLAIALGSAKSKWRARHSVNVLDSLDAIEAEISEAMAGTTKTVEAYKQLAATPITLDQFNAWIGAVYPATAKVRDDSTRGRKPTMLPTLQRKFTDGIGTNGRTAWDAYNAVTEYLTHDKGDTMGDTAASALESIMAVSNEILQVVRTDGTLADIITVAAEGHAIPADVNLLDWMLS